MSVRVALLNPWFWPEVRRGSERLVHDLAADLARLGHEPTLITSHRKPPTRTQEDGFEIVRVWRPPNYPLRKRNVQEAVTHLPFSYRELRRGHYDVAHPFFPSDGWAAVEWGQRTGRPVVFSYMGTPERKVLSSKRGRLKILERVTTQADAVTVLSPAARDAMWRWLGIEAEIVRPGVDLNRFSPGGERAAEPTIACLADAADHRKRVPLLVEAFERVRRDRPTARLLLQQPSDPAAAQRVSVDGVELVNPDSDGVVDVYRTSWATGLASRNEAFGLVLVESMACGTPVFGMRDGGVTTIVDRAEVGGLFDTDDPADVAQAINHALELAEDPKTAEACRARAEDFDTMHGARAYLAIYERLLAERRPA
jgi:glycosyltransferase involved in cell wall biosynthesis